MIRQGDGAYGSGKRIAFLHSGNGTVFQDGWNDADVIDGNAHYITTIFNYGGGGLSIDAYNNGTGLTETTNRATGWASYTGTENLTIGSRQGASYFFNGDLQNLFYYHAALSGSDLTNAHSYQSMVSGL